MKKGFDALWESGSKHTVTRKAANDAVSFCVIRESCIKQSLERPALDGTVSRCMEFRLFFFFFGEGGGGGGGGSCRRFSFEY